MTETEWLASDDPAAMLVWAQSEPKQFGAWVVGHRKLRLFTCACVRGRISRVRAVDDRTIRAVETGERYADGAATSKERGLAFNAADNLYHPQRTWAYACLRADPEEGAFEIVNMMHDFEGEIPAAQAAVLRDLVGNPFRPVRWSSCDHCHGTGWRTKIDRDNPGGSVSRPCRKCGPNPTVLSLATAAYEDRLPDGALDPVRLMVLADAMEEAGCEEGGGLLAHLRGQCPVCKGAGSCAREDAGVYYWPCEMCDATGRVKTAHYRGCHVLDLILGRE